MLLEPAQPKCTWTSREKTKSHQKGERVETTLNELQVLTLPIGTPSVALLGGKLGPTLAAKTFKLDLSQSLAASQSHPLFHQRILAGSLKRGVACSAVMMACFRFETKRLQRAMPAGFLSNAQDSQGDGLVHADHQCLPPASEKMQQLIPESENRQGDVILARSFPHFKASIFRSTTKFCRAQNQRPSCSYRASCVIKYATRR